MKDLNDRDLVCQYDFSQTDTVGHRDVEFIKEDIEVVRNTLPIRRDGSFTCLPHQDEGFVNGTWAKGETTARNEKRFVTEMQQKKIDYKSDGMNTLKYNLVNTEMFMDNCLMINVTL